MNILKQLQKCIGFDWDRHNRDKNWDKHKVSFVECEEFFFSHFIVQTDIKHSQHESRFYALGTTRQSRILFVVFTIRNNKIRIISARDANFKERNFYENSKV